MSLVTLFTELFRGNDGIETKGIPKRSESSLGVINKVLVAENNEVPNLMSVLLKHPVAVQPVFNEPR